MGKRGRGPKAQRGHVSSWLAFRAAVRHCLDLTYISVLSNRTSFLSPERNGINPARFFANSVSREEEQSYMQMVILYFSHSSYSSPQSILSVHCKGNIAFRKSCAILKQLLDCNTSLQCFPDWEQVVMKSVFFPAIFSSSYHFEATVLSVPRAATCNGKMEMLATLFTMAGILCLTPVGL